MFLNCELRSYTVVGLPLGRDLGPSLLIRVATLVERAVERQPCMIPATHITGKAYLCMDAARLD